MSCLVDSFENATITAAAAAEKKKRSPSTSRCGGLKGGVRGDAQGIGSVLGVTWADRYPMEGARSEGGVEGGAEGGDGARSVAFQVVEVGASDGAHSTARGKVPRAAVDSTAGVTSSAEPPRMIKTAPLPPKSPLPTKKQGRAVQAPAFGGADVKRTQEEEELQQRQEKDRKKREVRARRKEKERVRRRLYHVAARDVAGAGNVRNTSSRSSARSRSVSGGNEGTGESPARREAEHHHAFPPILQPTAPRGAEQEEGPYTERARREEGVSNGKKGETADSEGRGPSFCKGEVDYGVATIALGTEANNRTSGDQQGERGLDAAGALVSDEAMATSSFLRESSGNRHQQRRQEERPELLLRPTAPTQSLGEGEYRAKGTLERQGVYEEVGSPSTGSFQERANSEYGEEDFEIE